MTTWTNITDDGTNFDVFYPTSIAVNKNTNSPYYGRVFIGNGYSGPAATGWPPASSNATPMAAPPMKAGLAPGVSLGRRRLSRAQPVEDGRWLRR
jgi:hypothetical protein